MYLNFNGRVVINMSEVVSIVPSYYYEHPNFKATVTITDKAGNNATHIISGEWRNSSENAKEEARLAIINALAKATL